MGGLGLLLLIELVLCGVAIRAPRFGLVIAVALACLGIPMMLAKQDPDAFVDLTNAFGLVVVLAAVPIAICAGFIMAGTRREPVSPLGTLPVARVIRR